MTALDFPDSPYTGQVYDRWMYDGSKWVLGGGTTIMAPVALFARGVMREFGTGFWSTTSWEPAAVESGGWVQSADLQSWVVPRTGYYNLSLGFNTDSDVISRMILSIEGANEPGWLQEASAQRMSSSRVVYYTEGQSITPYFYNRGGVVSGRLTLSVAHIPPTSLSAAL